MFTYTTFQKSTVYFASKNSVLSKFRENNFEGIVPGENYLFTM